MEHHASYHTLFHGPTGYPTGPDDASRMHAHRGSCART